MNKKIRISFFGSSNFSIPTLNYLLKDDCFEVVSIITLPPVAKGRNQKISNNVVQDFAIQNDFKNDMIFTPLKLRNNNEIFSILKSQNLDFIVVVAYGKIIPKEIIDLPNCEILNLHPSALPKYRGAAPIERAIENGEGKIDICIMRVDMGLDTGDVCARKQYELNTNKGAFEIVPEIADIGGKMMHDVILEYYKKGLKFEKQSITGYSYAEKIEKNELFLDLQNKNLDAVKVFNKIRAFNNSGCCYFIFNDQRIKIISCELNKCKNSEIGFNNIDGKIYLKNGTITPIILQKEGKKPIKLKDFLNGLR